MAAILVAGVIGLVGPPSAMAQRPRGIDVAHYQGSIDWLSVKTSGVAFAWAKATEATYYIDPFFTSNAVHAKAAGVLLGAYHFARPDVDLGTAGADAEAAFFWSIVSNYTVVDGLTLMPVLDYETPPGTNYTKTTSSQWANRWCQDLVNYGLSKGIVLTPVVYCSHSFASSWLDSTVTQWPLWIHSVNGANPQTGAPTSVSPWSTWTAWQYDHAPIPGITIEDADEDVFNGTLTTLASTLVVGPMITVQPQKVSVAPGARTTFTVSATALVPLQYQWRFNQTNIAGATATTYTLAQVQLADAGGYSVAVGLAGGTKLSGTVLLSVLPPLSNAPGAVLAPSGLVNWWPAEGNANDIFGANQGTPCNGLSYVTGEQGWAFHFDGATSYVEVGAPSLAPPWTACLWVYRQDAPTGGAALMGDGTYELKLEQWNGTRQVGFTQFKVGDYSFGYIVPARVWTHLAFVGTSTGTSLYVNGTLQATLSQTLPLPRACIGAGYVTSTGKYVDHMLGSLDEILLFNRALSAAELYAIYSAGSAGLVRVPEFTGIQPLGSEQVQLSLKGQTGKGFSVYASPDLVNWTRLGGTPNPAGTNQYVDSTATVLPRFYRASQP